MPSIKKALVLEYITLLWNVIGCITVIIASLHSSSVSLFAFGIDSIIEIFASLIVIWQIKAINKNKEALAMKLIGIAFLLLAIYIIVQSTLTVIHHTKSHPSFSGIVWLTITAVAMFLLAYGKRTLGIKINNTIVIKEAKVTLIDALLAVSVLIGLLLTKYFAWWWADTTASAIIALYAIKEAVQTF